MSQAAADLVMGCERVTSGALAAMLALAVRCSCRSAPLVVQISTADFAADLRLSPRRVRYVLDGLISSGLIEVVTPASGRTPAVYRLTP